MGRRRIKAPRPLHRSVDAVRASSFEPSCTWKRRYETEQEALNMREIRIEQMRAQRPYECRHCNGWHMTTSKRDA